MPSSRASRKHQARLAFTPLPSSSPATTPYNQQIRERAAAVTYDGSPGPSKRRKVRDAPEQATEGHAILAPDSHKSNLPTPDPTFQPAVSTDPRIGLTLARSSGLESKHKHARQKTLDFGSALANRSSPVSHALRSSRRTPQKQTKFFGSQKSFTSSVNVHDSDSDSDDEPTQPTKRSTQRTHKTRNLRSSISEDPRDSGSPLTTIRKASDNFVNFSEGSDSDLPTTPALARRQDKDRVNEERGHKSSAPLTLESDSEEIVPSRSRSGRKRDAVSSDEDHSDGSVIAIAIPTSRKRLQRGHTSGPNQQGPREVAEPQSRAAIINIDSGSENDVSPRRKRRRVERAEQEEIEDELLDIQDDSPAEEEEPRSSRSVHGTKKHARLEALERYKRRRAGHQVDDDDDVDDAQEERDDDEAEAPLPSTSRHDMFTREEADDDFLADDGDDTLGQPVDLPLAFTNFASSKAKDLFKYAVEWMVQKKINPAFQHDDEVYDLAFKKLDDEVKGLAGSKFISAAWIPDFAFALRARPQIAFEPIDRHGPEAWMLEKCDACNRTGHPATWKVQFLGKPYYRESLEEVAGPEDSDSDDTSDVEQQSPTRDEHGRQIVDESKVYNVGKFCMSNTETAHALQHWRIHLYEWVVEWLEAVGYNSPENIVQRDKWSERKRRKYANKIVDEMEAQGKIKTLHRDFKDEIDRARNAKQGRWDSSP